MTDLAGTPSPGGPAVPELLVSGRKRSHSGMLKLIDGITKWAAISGALVMCGLLILLLGVVSYGAWPAMKKLGLPFLWNNNWSVTHQDFGAFALIYGTLVTAVVALVISFPISLGSAIFLTKLAPKVRIPVPNFRRGSSAALAWASPRHFVTVVSFLIELLAAIPSIAYGLWGVFVLVPFMQAHVQPVMASTLGNLPGLGTFFQDLGTGQNLFTAGIILSIMVTPIMTAIMRDVLAVAPPELEQGALGLGATWWQATRLVLGFSTMGLFGAVILGFARAIGETMAVTMVVGNSIQMDKTVFSPGYSIASKLANQFNNADTAAEKEALIYAALVLLVITTVINGIARLMVMRVARRAKRR